ncbi:unnamed protein product [Musa hybrid cultivar]
MTGCILNSAGNSSGPSVGASSIVNDANSALSGTQLQRSASINNEPCMRLPASPMSFSSNSTSDSWVMDGSIMQQSLGSEHAHKRAASSAISEIIAQAPDDSVHISKKARLDLKDDIMQRMVIQQLLQGSEPEPELHGHQNPQLHAMLQQQRLTQLQQHMMQSFPQTQQAPITFQQQQQLRNHLQQRPVEVAVPANHNFDVKKGSCRVMQYLYHQRHRPADNSILYWRKFVAEYFAPPAKKRWCLSSYNNVGNHALGVFLQSAKGTWNCDLCVVNSGKGFEVTFGILPRFFQIKFESGLVDENLFLGMPRECHLSKGFIVMEYDKVALESVYEHLRIVREGILRVIFTPELKILSWDFCVQRHKEFLPRRVLAPQVDQLLKVAQKYQTSVNKNGSARVPHQELQACCNLFTKAGHQLTRNLELQSPNELGLSRKYVWFIQISEVVNSMKDLFDFSKEHNSGPIESLKNYTIQAAAYLQRQKLQEMDQSVVVHSLPSDQNMLKRHGRSSRGRQSYEQQVGVQTCPFMTTERALDQTY